MNRDNGADWMRDTRPEAQDAYFNMLASMTLGQRVERALQLTRTVHEIACEGIRRRHQEYSEREDWMAMIRPCHGDDVFEAFFPGSAMTP